MNGSELYSDIDTMTINTYFVVAKRSHIFTTLQIDLDEGKPTKNMEIYA